VILEITQCPICEGKTFTPYLSCIDYTVSHETFQLTKCETCRFIITSPRPDNGSLPKYYLSADYISHSNRSATLVDKVYQVSRSFSLRWKINLIKEHDSRETSARKILDFGCGTGEFLNRAKEKGFSISGVEPSDIARLQAAKLTDEKIEATINNVKGEFSAITLWHVLEHVPELNELIEKLKTRLEKNGTIFIAVPNHESLDAKFYQDTWAGYDVPRHLWHFSRSTMTKLLTKHSLKIERIIPMKLDSFYVSMLSEKYIRKKNSIPGLLKAFINGMKSNFNGSRTKDYSSLIYVVKK
jgi:2-polyprenyl-3-methyl-5-hydroxy-6-metoxy-1,4-benzoquinol methylase